MTRIRIFLVLSAVLLAGSVWFTFGGGGGNNNQSGLISGYTVPAIVKPAALPNVCPDNIKVLPKALQDAQTKRLSTACIVEFPDNLQSTPYCVNKSTNWGGANITIPPLSDQGSVDLPKNCYFQVDQEKVRSKTVVCSGPAGSTVTLTVRNSCSPPDANLPDVDPACPQGYSRKFGDPACHYVPPENAPDCQPGYRYDSVNNCCYGSGSLIPDSFSACPDGYELGIRYQNSVAVGESCYPKNRGSFTMGSRSYTVTLGYCNLNKPNSGDNGSGSNTDNSTPCVINPATGACK